MTSPIALLPDTDQQADDGPGLAMATCEQGWLPLTEVALDATVSRLDAAVIVRQTYVNPFDHPIEANYIHPLPDRAAVTAFAVTIGERRIEGMLQERGRARAEYDAAIASGHRAAITEEDRPDVFTTRVGNLQPGDRAEVELTLVQPLPWEDGQVELRFPTVVAPRYIPGKPLDGASVGEGVALDTEAVPDASRISPPVLLPGLPNPVRLDARVRFSDRVLPSGLQASLHSVVEEGSTVAVKPGERLDRDIILRWDGTVDGTAASAPAAVATTTADEATIDNETTTADEAAGDEATSDRDRAQGTFTFVLHPPVGEGPRPGRDVVIVLDRSGSMGGWKMVAARRATARIVDTLGPHDRFQILAFDNRIDRPPRLPEHLIPATDRNRWLAVEWLASVEARGGTELRTPLQQAVKELQGASEERDRSCILITDGQVGNEDQILAGVGSKLSSIRVFTVGIDRAVNTGFLRRLAALGGGRCELVESEDRLDDVMRAVHGRIAAPVLESVTLRAEPDRPDGAGSIHGLSPAGPVDCFAGVPLVIRGRYRGELPRLQWSATGLDGEVTTATVEVEAVESPAARPLWARARIRDLEDRVSSWDAGSSSDRDALDDEIVQVSLTTGVLSRYTAFVAVDTSERVDSTSPMPVIQPVELPSGWPSPVAGAPMVQSMATAMPAGMPGATPSPMVDPMTTAAGAPPTRSAPGMPRARSAMPRVGAGRRRRWRRGRRPVPTGQAPVGGAGLAPPPRPGGTGRPDREPIPLALDRYLARLGEIMDHLEAGERSPRIGRELEDLLGDLRSVEAPPALIERIEHLLATLRTGSPLDESLAELRTTVATLGTTTAPTDRSRASGAGAEPPTGTPDRQRRGRFWR